MKIHAITISEVLDSRGLPTIEVALEDMRRDAYRAQIPSGKSTGTREAAVLKVGAVPIQKLQTALLGKEFFSIQELDRFLIELDGTPQKEVFGGNTLLGISIAFTRMCAAHADQEVWEVLRSEFFPHKISVTPPVIFSNLINGGLHAGNNLNIQEYMVIVTPSDSMKGPIDVLKALYVRLGERLKKKKGVSDIKLGDEGGYSIDFTGNFEPLQILNEELENEGEITDAWRLGVDVAASSLFKDGAYSFEHNTLNARELIEVYKGYFEKLPRFLSIEDPFEENDEKSFMELQQALPEKMVVGDDFTTTNPQIIQDSIAHGAIRGVIIKPNQIGTVSEACEAMRVAEAGGARCIVSHRSGEVPDAFIIHLAKAGEAYGVKIGAPVRERLVKFNELERLFS